MPKTTSTVAYLSLAGCIFALPACGITEGVPLNERPATVKGEILKHSFDAEDNDDLLTAGLGASGLQSDEAPSVADPQAPTTQELRRLAIWNNYRALVPTAPGGGYGEFFGPDVGNAEGEGKIPGDEWLAFIRSGDARPGKSEQADLGRSEQERPGHSGEANLGQAGRVTAMVQVPESFDVANACMVTAPSSGSRGIYGAIGTAGEWGLKRGCAVVYTDKGTGTGAHNLAENRTQAIDGLLVDARPGRTEALFRADLTEAQRRDFEAEYPHRFAFKHAHSGRNPEQDWGENVLESIRFGFYVLNELHGETDAGDRRLRSLTPENTLVIASSVSNGGGASVLAAEADSEGLIDGVAVSEPNVQPTVDEGFSIQQGEANPISEHSRSLLDYTTALAVYQGCANQAEGLEAAPLNLVTDERSDNICARLADLGLIDGADVEAQAADALRVLNEEFALQSEQNLAQPGNFAINVPQSISITYGNAYGRFSVTDNLCGFSFASTNAETFEPQSLDEAAERVLFSTSNGIPPTGGVNAVYNLADEGPTEMSQASSPGGVGRDYALDGFLCLRGLVTGENPANADGQGRAAPQESSQRVHEGIDAIHASGDLRGKPAVFVTPRADQILPINHTSRPYYGLNQRVEGDNSNLHYYEVLNAQHLDVLNNIAGFDALFIPLHHYYFQALDLMYDHLRNGASLPPSQVVRTQPRGTEDGEAPPLSEENLPSISAEPDAGNRILFEDEVLRIPD
ncbi:3-hydroxybutyrate oligomer hydrolase family protein [Aquisalimonas sp.]|uniref:3-hydroxybutyrate oligomer hydrolase family protein n=1 Tax=Aquisalimonas sp. TaxID=1872621 RepID=UPI0025C4FC41|nr:3-hydroxybutyrate oligomer hydrolase family protein [Aquisalimonas sp.]